MILLAGISSKHVHTFLVAVPATHLGITLSMGRVCFLAHEQAQQAMLCRRPAAVRHSSPKSSGDSAVPAGPASDGGFATRHCASPRACAATMPVSTLSLLAANILAHAVDLHELFLVTFSALGSRCGRRSRRML